VGLFELQAVGVGRIMPLPTSIVATGLAAIIFGIGWGWPGTVPATIWAPPRRRMDAVFALLGDWPARPCSPNCQRPLIPCYTTHQCGADHPDDLFGNYGVAVACWLSL